MHRNFFVILVVLGMAFLVACSKQLPPPAPPEPTNVSMEIDLSPDVNPNPEGRPSPLVVRVYELKSLSGFNNADFLSLYGKDKETLGADLVRKQEFVLQPNEKKALTLRDVDDAAAIGVFALFNKYEQAQSKGSAEIQPHATTIVNVRAEGTSLTVDSSLQKTSDGKK